MRTTLLVLIVAVVCLAPASDAVACGDKYLVRGSGLGYLLAFPASQAASILMYNREGAPATATMNDPKLQSTLQLHGHSYRTVSDWSKFLALLQTGDYNLVLADISDAPAIRKEMAVAGSKALIVPLMHEASRAEAKIARKEYRYILRTPARASRLAMKIDVVAAEKDKS